jgi:uncharacterized membrane protein YfcA
MLSQHSENNDVPQSHLSRLPLSHPASMPGNAPDNPAWLLATILIPSLAAAFIAYLLWWQYDRDQAGLNINFAFYSVLLATFNGWSLRHLPYNDIGMILPVVLGAVAFYLAYIPFRQLQTALTGYNRKPLQTA